MRRDRQLGAVQHIAARRARLRARGQGQQPIFVDDSSRPPNIRGSDGDLHVLVNVQVPSRLSAKQRELLEEFAAEAGEVDRSAT